MPRYKEIFEIWRRDNSLTQALYASYRMLDRTGMMFQTSVSALRQNGSENISASIFKEDQAINKYHQEVRRKVLQHLAITGGANLISGLVLASIVDDIERIGDYTKNITELAAGHSEPLSCGHSKEDVVRMEDTVTDVFARIIPILESSNLTAARALISESLWIRKSCDNIVQNLVKEQDETLRPGSAVVLALYVRYLKRISAHLMNILSSVVNPYDRIGYREGNV